MTITMEDIMNDPKGYILRLNKGGILSLSNWWIFHFEVEGVYLFDQGGWDGLRFYFKLGDDGHCLANTQEGWVDIGVFEVVTQKEPTE